MTALRFGLAVVFLFLVNACATMEGTAPRGKLEVGQTEAELLEKLGQPQQTLPNPQGGKIYVYTTCRLDQISVMGGGAWGKPEQTHYWLDPQGIISKVDFYPYGKRAFVFSSREGAVTKQAVTSPQTSVPPVEASQPSPAAPSPQATAPKAEPVKPAPPSLALDAATRLEPNMTKNEVQRLLGIPDRTEGFMVAGKPVVVWFYPLKNLQGRAIPTPLVFEKNRLIGWGEGYYRQLQKKAAP